MKRRSRSREKSSHRKRSRSRIPKYNDSSDERISPEQYKKKKKIRTPSPKQIHSPIKTEYVRSRDVHYKILCVSALHHKASDDAIKDTLYREYRRFGDVTVKINHDSEERVAYVCFKSTEDARDAKKNKPRIILCDKVAVVEPVYEVRPKSPEEEKIHRIRPRTRSHSPEYERYHRTPDRQIQDRITYERMYGSSLRMMYRDYRHDMLPPPPPPVPHHHHQHFDPHLRGPHLTHHSLPPHAIPMIPHHFGHPHMMHNRYNRVPPVQYENVKDHKKEKFPNYLQHIPPEEDPLATRTLFAGNLEVNISDEELRKIFSRYGIVEDIDIKRPLPGTGNAYAFVRYQNLDMAHRSKVELSGQYIGKFQCKIGYGKPTPTTRIWVGGLGIWTTVGLLEREFDRFGAIQRIDFIKGDSQAYILYDSIDAATAAVKEMRGYPLGGSERKLRVDFADNVTAPSTSKQSTSSQSPDLDMDYKRDYSMYDVAYNSQYSDLDYYPYGKDGPWPSVSDETIEYRNFVNEYDWDKTSSGRVKQEMENMRELANLKTLKEVCDKCTIVWKGGLILKNSLFPLICHLTEGNKELIDSLIYDGRKTTILKITQRLRLEDQKLNDVMKRIQASTSYAIFLAMPTTLEPNLAAEEGNIQSRPLKNIVSYLKQKEAAGVLTLMSKTTETTGVLYVFPCCPFTLTLLRRSVVNLTEECLNEGHLVIVLVTGGGSA